MKNGHNDMLAPIRAIPFVVSTSSFLASGFSTLRSPEGTSQELRQGRYGVLEVPFGASRISNSALCAIPPDFAGAWDTHIMMTLEDWRRFYAEEVRWAANLNSPALVEAYARVPRDKYLGPPPWQIGSADLRAMSISGLGSLTYRTTDDPHDLYHNVVVALVAAHDIAGLSKLIEQGSGAGDEHEAGSRNAAGFPASRDKGPPARPIPRLKAAERGEKSW